MKGTTPCPDTATLGSDFTIQIKPFITRPAHLCHHFGGTVITSYYGFHLKHWMSLGAFELDTQINEFK